MLTSLRIQNFRSIRDASVKLGQVNLFIGPNNSGKSNFLKGIEFLAHITHEYPNGYSLEQKIFESLLPRTQVLYKREDVSINFGVGFSFSTLFFGISPSNPIQLFSPDFKQPMFVSWSDSNKNIESKDEPYNSFNELKQLLTNAVVYKTVLSAINFTSTISADAFLAQDGSNLISFLFNLSQNHKKIYNQLEKGFADCVGNLVSLATPVNPNSKEPGTFKLKFFDQNDVGYWAEEVSEGVLYFLALLCIVHQPDPPKLLLLEEPEKGIHPRRIREVMDFIFELARLRDIQIILTSHSPYVVDYFADIPECISVFDRENGETVIHNAGDIISETNDRLKAAGQEPIHYTDSLGEYWVSGFLGGVPL